MIIPLVEKKIAFSRNWTYLIVISKREKNKNKKKKALRASNTKLKGLKK